MEAVVERENMKTAWLRVKGNKGAAGVDGMSVDALLPYLREHWPSIKEDLLAGGINRAGAEGRDTQARRRDAAIGHTDGSGPPHPTGVASGFTADV